MYETVIPNSTEAREKRGKSLTRRHTLIAACSFLCALLAVLFLIGVVVLVFVLEFSNADRNLIFALIGSFAGGAIVTAVAAFMLMKGTERLEKRKNDYFERCDSEESFFVGEGTLATFTDSELVMHSDSKKNKIRVPYTDMRFISVCSRRAPRESGEWSVVLEIPARYIAKAGMGAKNDPPALIQTDMKPRILKVLKERNLPLIGELPPETPASKEKFKAEKAFYLPNRKKRRRAVMLLGLGILLTAAGIPVGFLLDLTVGAVLTVLGVLIACRAAFSYMRARAMFAIYKEGVYWQDSDRTENIFLKWEEIERYAAEEKEGYPVIAFYMAYGAYRFPRPEGAWEYLEQSEMSERGGSNE